LYGCRVLGKGGLLWVLLALLEELRLLVISGFLGGVCVCCSYAFLGVAVWLDLEVFIFRLRGAMVRGCLFE